MCQAGTHGAVQASNGHAGVVYTASAKNGEVHTVESHVMDDYVQPGLQQPPRAIADGAARALLHVLRLAVATAKPPFVIIALSTVQQVVAAGFVQGEISSLILEGEGRSGGEPQGMLARGLSMTPAKLGVAAQALHLVCACEDCCSDEEVEVRTEPLVSEYHVFAEMPYPCLPDSLFCGWTRDLLYNP